jgi:5'(3')-deoxyribonucleotidase
MTNKQKLILTDIDDTTVNWASEFERYLRQTKQHLVPDESLQKFHNIEEWLHCTLEETRQLIYDFNHIDYIWRDLPPLPHAVEAIEELTNMGYKFVAITACSQDESTLEGRWNNLRTYFDDAFVDCIAVGLGQSKLEYLKKYDPTYWVEDKFKHAMSGIEAGHKSFLIDYEHNRQFEDDRITRVSDWSEIVQYIKNDTQNIS